MDLNLIYHAHQGEPIFKYKNELGTIWRSNSKRAGFHNISLSWHGLQHPTEQEDSIFVLEPRCVHEVDYNLEYLKKMKFVFTWSAAFDESEIKHKVVKVNHPNIGGDYSGEYYISRWKSWSERQSKIAIVANKKTGQHDSELYPLRFALADHLHNHIGVDWYCKENIGRKYWRGPVDTALINTFKTTAGDWETDKVELLKNYKFTICSENSYDSVFSQNYFTEKMMHAWMAGCVPIYMGCYNIDDLFPSSSYIDLRTYVFKHGKALQIDYQSLISRLANMNEEHYNAMMESVKELMNRKDGLFHVCSWERVYETMLKTFNQTNP